MALFSSPEENCRAETLKTLEKQEENHCNLDANRNFKSNDVRSIYVIGCFRHIFHKLSCLMREIIMRLKKIITRGFNVSMKCDLCMQPICL